MPKGQCRRYIKTERLRNLLVVRSLKITQRKTYRRYLYVFTEHGQFVILINAIGIIKGKFIFPANKSVRQ